MAFDIGNINIPKSPFLDTSSNRPTREWLLYLLGLGRTFAYGSFSALANQSVATINTPNRVVLSSTDYSKDMYYTAGDGIHLQQGGLYNVQFSVQVLNTDTQAHDADFWFRKNGVDIPNTASVVSVLGTHGGQPGYFIAAANFFVQFNAGDYIEMWWSTNSTQMSLQYLPAITTPFPSPGAPAVVITLSQVSL